MDFAPSLAPLAILQRLSLAETRRRETAFDELDRIEEKRVAQAAQMPPEPTYSIAAYARERVTPGTPKGKRNGAAMVSRAQLMANRANARRSTGPRTVAGKARARRNALRHGLSIPLSSDSASAERIEALTDTLCGKVPAPREIIRSVAEAQLTLIRAEDANAETLNRGMPQLPGEQHDLSDNMGACLGLADLLPELAALGRYRRRASSKCKKMLGVLDDQITLQTAKAQPHDNAEAFDHLLERKTAYLMRIFCCNSKLIRHPYSRKARDNRRRAIIGMARVAREYILCGRPDSAIRDTDEALTPGLAPDALALIAVRACALLITGQDVDDIFARYRGEIADDKPWQAIVRDQARRLRKAPGVQQPFYSEIERLLRSF